ncbi:hypothetical protein [Actinomyces howellii]|uniref:Uncharacterized protein n=1 Tax=Actinomyces howellii TaxID=52771 RepID=A0A3S4RXR6_9ACTO|nr:hypothetical protein [Actinomyces howellii]VEG29512.1 Uncharacterised protein [Actinomyces howellii]
MGVRYMVLVPDPNQVIFDADTFVKEAQVRWPGCRVFVDDPSKAISDASVRVDSADDPTFMVIHFPDCRALTTDGLPYQAAEVAVWVREVHPDPGLVLWLIDNGFAAHVVLHPGITTDEIHAGWVDHREHNPYEEFPQYFGDW